jgi:hypothetical protein
MGNKWFLRIFFILLLAISIQQTRPVYATGGTFTVDEHSSYMAKFNAANLKSDVKEIQTGLKVEKPRAQSIVAGKVTRSFIDKLMLSKSIATFFTDLGCEIEEEFYEDVSKAFGDISIYRGDKGFIDEKLPALIHIAQWKKSRKPKSKDVEIIFPKIVFEWFLNPKDGVIIRFGEMNKITITARKSKNFLINATILENKLVTNNSVLYNVNVVYQKGYFAQYEAQLKN